MGLIEDLVNSQASYQLLVAAAGSGKTYTLTHVVAERINNGLLNPEHDRIVVFTFTKNAADELVARLQSLLKANPNLINNLYIGTIHGWCNEFLSSRGLLSNTKVIDELERAQLISRIYPVLKLDSIYVGKNRFVKIDKFIKDMEIFYDEGFDIDDSSIPPKVKGAIRSYLDFLESQRLMDFGYLIMKSIELLSEESSDHSAYNLFVDEYQDVNPAQVKLFKSMIGNCTQSRIFAVGDPRQAIYQWRGGDVSRLLSFPDDFPGAEVVNMTENRRSRRGIVKAANEVARCMDMGSNIEIDDMTCSAERDDNYISVIHNTNSVDHADEVVKIVNELISSGIKPSGIAILLRSVVNHGTPILEKLAIAGIPYSSPNKNQGIDFVADVMLSIIGLVELMAFPTEPRNRAEEEARDTFIADTLSKIAPYCSVSREEIYRQIAIWYYKMTKQKIRSSSFENECYNYRQQFFDFCKAIGFTLPKENADITKGFAAVTQIMKAIEEAYRRRLRGYSNMRPKPIDVFLYSLRWQLENSLERWTETGDGFGTDKGVTVSTVHAAKGLEWPIVIIPYMWSGRFPLRNSSHGSSYPDEVAERYGTTEEDERHLYYVAVTRARDRLYLLSGSSTGKQSAFIDEMHLDSNRWATISDRYQLKKYSSVANYSKKDYFHIGVSEFLVLLECPYSFNARYVIGVDVPVGEELGAGNIIHRVIERMLNGETDIDNIVDEEVFLPLGEYSHEVAVKKSIKSKVVKLMASPIVKEIQDAEYGFTIPIEDIIVTGIVDATRATKDGLEIIDWKFNLHEEFKERYENQIRLYAFALSEIGQKVIGGKIVDIGNNGYEHPVDISSDAMQKMLALARTKEKALGKEAVTPTIAPATCNACDITRICPYFKTAGRDNED